MYKAVLSGDDGWFENCRLCEFLCEELQGEKVNLCHF